ncbi:MAG: FAD binding domain-containing protein [Candidatus Caldarchaeum sp.]|nr:FAD binding domain-containing protein [Candidatus Caldarchaeales archaeon]
MKEINESFLMPESVNKALQLKKLYRDSALVVSGGTASVQLVTKMLISPAAIISLENLPLNYVKKKGNMIEIGATTTAAEILESDGVPNCLLEAAKGIHGLALKQNATIGGNIFTPAPGGDMATALLSLDAQLIMSSSRGRRIVPLTKFYKGPLTYNIRSDELLIAIRIGKPPKHSMFMKQSIYKYGGQTLASVSVALDSVDKVKRVGVAVGGLTPHPYRASRVEKMLLGQKISEELIETTAQNVAEEASDTGLVSKEYLRHLAGVLYKRILTRLTSSR